MGFRVCVLGFGVWGLDLDLDFRFRDLALRVQVGVEGSDFRVRGLGFRAWVPS